MVQIIEDPYARGIGGRIGAGIGKGVAESLSTQLPKEVERYRLASGLRQFEKEAAGLSPLQQYTRLAAIPGFTAEHGYNIAPLLRQQAISQAAGQIAGKGQQGSPQGNVAGQPGISPAAMPRNIHQQEGAEDFKGALKPIENTRAQLEPIVRRSDAELLATLSPEDRMRSEDLLPLLRNQEEARIANLQEQRAVGEAQDKRREISRKELERRWGNEDTRKQIPGTVQTKLERNVEEALANPNNKLSESQLYDKYGEAGRRIAETQTNLDAKAQQGWFSGNYTPTKVRNTINEAARVYRKAEASEEFKNIIQDKFSLSPQAAAILAIPPSNPKGNEIVAKAKPAIATGISGYKDNMTPKKVAIKLADELTGVLGKEDSLLSYTMALRRKGIDSSEFFKRLQQNSESGLFDPSPMQVNELEQGPSFFPGLGDIYLFTISDLIDELEELATP